MSLESPLDKSDQIATPKFLSVNEVLRFVGLLYSSLMILCIKVHSTSAAVVIAVCIIVLLAPVQKFPSSVGKLATRIVNVIATALLIYFVCKPYQIPISTPLVHSQDEGEGYVLNTYSVVYYAPKAPLMLVKVDIDAIQGVRYARGYVRYSPLDWLNTIHVEAFMVRNLPKDVKIVGSKEGRS